MDSNQGYKAGVSIPPIDVSQRNLELSNIYGVSRCHEVLLVYESIVVLSLGVLLDSKNQDKLQNCHLYFLLKFCNPTPDFYERPLSSSASKFVLLLLLL